MGKHKGKYSSLLEIEGYDFDYNNCGVGGLYVIIHKDSGRKLVCNSINIGKGLYNLSKDMEKESFEYVSFKEEFEEKGKDAFRFEVIESVPTNDYDKAIYNRKCKAWAEDNLAFYNYNKIWNGIKSINPTFASLLNSHSLQNLLEDTSFLSGIHTSTLSPFLSKYRKVNGLMDDNGKVIAGRKKRIARSKKVAKGEVRGKKIQIGRQDNKVVDDIIEEIKEEISVPENTNTKLFKVNGTDIIEYNIVSTEIIKVYTLDKDIDGVHTIYEHDLPKYGLTSDMQEVASKARAALEDKLSKMGVM